jgi:hypothetical protein
MYHVGDEVTGFARLGAGLLASALALPGLARAEAPRMGDVQRLKVITIAMNVGSTEKETKQVTYTPPPGWYVRSHSVHCARRFGHSSFSVNTVPQDWNWLSEEKVRESYRLLIEGAARANEAGLQSRFGQERDAVLSELRRVRSTHHALVVEATARGEGFLRGGGGIELTVTAELVYLGTDESWARATPRPRRR